MAHRETSAYTEQQNREIDHIYPCPGRDSNPRSQYSSDLRPCAHCGIVSKCNTDKLPKLSFLKRQQKPKPLFHDQFILLNKPKGGKGTDI